MKAKKKMENPTASYERKWVALTPDNKKVIASNKDFKKLHDKLKKMKIAHTDAVMSYVRPSDGFYVPCLRK